MLGVTDVKVEAVYKGSRSLNGEVKVVKVIGQEERRLVNTGCYSNSFDWGSNNGGSADLARSLLSDVAGDHVLSNPVLCRRFKEQFILNLGSSWTLTAKQVKNWMEEQ